MYQAKASKECLDVVKSLMASKLKPRASICTFILEMKGYFDRLESLNMVFDVELSINIILSGLPADYNQKIDVPSTSAAPVFIVGHNAKKRKTKRVVTQGLKESKRLNHGELNLVIRNRKIMPVTRIGKYELMLRSGVRIDLNNCCYS
nr:hypothetical protein [Tanacetum cinerariifolium]